jgi:hypothetical protein
MFLIRPGHVESFINVLHRRLADLQIYGVVLTREVAVQCHLEDHRWTVR